MSTGPPFERLYAVEPDGVEQMIPSHGCTPELLAADRELELDHAAERGARDDDVVDRARRAVRVLDLERRQLDDLVLAGEHAREPGLEVARGPSSSGSRRGRS